MPDRTDHVITLLRSMDASLKKLVSGIAQPDVAAPADLDSPHGNPELHFSPRDWNGDNYKGKRFSECPPELLDLVASSLDYFATKADEKNETTAGGKPLGPYKRKDAARARGWAKRLRDGWVPAKMADPLLDSKELDEDPFNDETMPF